MKRRNEDKTLLKKVYFSCVRQVTYSRNNSKCLIMAFNRFFGIGIFSIYCGNLTENKTQLQLDKLPLLMLKKYVVAKGYYICSLYHNAGSIQKAYAYLLQSIIPTDAIWHAV